MADIASWLGTLQPWKIWLLAALLILIIDLVLLGGLMSSGGGITLVLAGGALGAMVGAAFGAELAGQISGGVIGMVVTGFLVFWIGRRWAGHRQRNRPDDPRIRDAIVRLEPYNNGLGVRILGDMYPARPEQLQQTLNEGEPVRVLRFQGITAVVQPVTGGTDDTSNHSQGSQP